MEPSYQQTVHTILRQREDQVSQEMRRIQKEDEFLKERRRKMNKYKRLRKQGA